MVHVLAMYWTLKLMMNWLKFHFHVKFSVFWFNLMDWIESGGEAKIQIAIRDHIQFPTPCSFSILPPHLKISFVSRLVWELKLLKKRKENK